MISTIDALEEIELILPETFDPLRSRSVLAPLHPLGIGTAYRESLTSYFERLADQHCLSPKVISRDFVIPRLGLRRGDMAYDVDRFWEFCFFNGVGEIPSKWVPVLEGLTGVKGLGHLTLLPLKGLVGHRGIAAYERRWCPLCLHEGEKAGSPYGQLLWHIGAVRACPKHGVRLVSVCGCDPAEHIHALKIKHLPQLCQHCGKSLAKSEAGALEPATEGELRDARIVAELLASRLFEKADPWPIRHRLKHFLKAALRGFGDAARLARAIGVGKASVSGWVNGKHKPGLTQVIAIAAALDLSMEEVLNGRGVVKLVAKQVRPSSPRPQKLLREAALTNEEWRVELKRLSKVEPPMSLAMMARALGTSSRELRRRNPSLSKVIAARCRACKKEHAMNQRQERLEQVRAIVLEVVQEGLVPTRRRLEDRLQGVPKFFLSAESSAVAEIRKEVAQQV